MNRIFIIFLTCISLFGCDDKDSSDLDVDSELRLEVAIEHIISNDEFASNYKITRFEFQLFEDQINQLKILQANRHIVVKNSGEFIATINGTDYDLSEYYRSSNSLITDFLGNYEIVLEDHQEELNHLSIRFTFEGGTFTSDIDIPESMVVINSIDTLEGYNPLSDDILLEWQNVTLPADISASQTLFLNNIESDCASENLEYELLTEDVSTILAASSYVFECFDGTQDINKVNTSIEFLQNKVDIPFDSIGFKDVEVTYEQSYFWFSSDTFLTNN